MLEETLKATGDPERRENVIRMQTLLRAYEGDFSKALKAEEERERSIEQGMNPIGAKARNNLTEIVRSAISEDDYAVAAHAGIAQEGLMLARVSALHFIAANDKAEIEEFARRIEAFTQVMTELQNRLTDPGRQALAAESVTLARDYATAFRKVVATTTEAHDLVGRRHGRHRCGVRAGR